MGTRPMDALPFSLKKSGGCIPCYTRAQANVAWGEGLLLHIQELKQLDVGEQAQVGDTLAVETVLSLMKKQVEGEELRVEAGQHEGQHQSMHLPVPE